MELKDTVTILEVLTPLSVAFVTVVGTVLVAKINKVQKQVQDNNTQVGKVQSYMTTNHGSKSLGDAIDIIRTKVDVIGDNQDDLIGTVKKMHQRDSRMSERISKLEAAAENALHASERAEQVVTDSIRIVTQHDEEK